MKVELVHIPGSANISSNFRHVNKQKIVAMKIKK